MDKSKTPAQRIIFIICVIGGLCIGVGLALNRDKIAHLGPLPGIIIVGLFLVAIPILKYFAINHVAFDANEIIFSNRNAKQTVIKVSDIQSCDIRKVKTSLASSMKVCTFTFHDGKKESVCVDGALFDTLKQEVPSRYGFPTVITE